MLTVDMYDSIWWNSESRALHGPASTPLFMLFPLPLTPFPVTPAEKYPEKLSIHV